MSIVASGAYTTPASPVVVDQIERLNGLADELIEKTEASVLVLQNLSFANQDLDPRLQWDEGDLESLLNQLGTINGIDPNTDWLQGLDLTAGDENFKFDPTILGLLSQPLPEYVLPAPPVAPVFPLPPSDPGEPEALVSPVKPVLGDYYLDPADVTVDEAVPELVDYTAGIAFPTMREIIVPPVPVLQLDAIVFDAAKPVFGGVVPDAAEFQFEGSVYDPLMLERIKTEIYSMMDGEKGLPPAIENAIFERGREQEMELAERDVEQARTEYSARGYKYPPGAVAARVDRIRMDASKKVSALNRDQTIKVFEIQIDLYKTALASAIQLEDIWMRQFAASERLRFEAASLKLNFAMQIFGAFVQRYNAEAQMFQVEATVYHERIQAEIAKLSAYTAQLEGLKLVSEINQQDVQIYVERIKALLVNVEIYKARIEGYTAKFEAVKARVEVFKAELESNKTLADIYDVDTKAFATLAQAQQYRDQRFQIKADIYGKNVDSLSKQTELALSYYEINFKKAELQRDTFVANSERIKEMIAAESARIQALTDKYQALAAEIGAKADVEKAKYALLLSIAQARVERMKAAAEILLKNAETAIQSALTAEGLMLKAKETATTVLGQLAAGFTSAANVNATISDASSSTIGYSFTGELDVA